MHTPYQIPGVALHSGARPSSLVLDTVWPTHWPVFIQAIAVGLVIDFSLYAVHWLSHRYAWLWKFHAVHHSAERLYWLNGERRHPLHAAMMAGPGLVLVVLLGAPAHVVGAWLAFLAVHLAFQHSNLDYRIGWLRHIVGAAEVHRWHHKREYEDAQVNFGEFWMLWDHLFGTFRMPKEPLQADSVGLNDVAFPRGYWPQLLSPFKPNDALPSEQQQHAAVGMAATVRRHAFHRELAIAHHMESNGNLSGAWRVLELAHVIGQPAIDTHVISHLAMFGLAWRTNNWREASGQFLRLALLPVGHLLGRLPPSNPGTTRVGALVADRWPAELDPLTLERQPLEGISNL